MEHAPDPLTGASSSRSMRGGSGISSAGSRSTSWPTIRSRTITGSDSCRRGRRTRTSSGASGVIASSRPPWRDVDCEGGPGEGAGTIPDTCQFVAILEPGETALHERLRHALSEFSVVRSTSPLDGRSIWVEVRPRAVGKERAIAWLAARYRLGPGGDGCNRQRLQRRWNAPLERQFVRRRERRTGVAGSSTASSRRTTRGDSATWWRL